MNRGDLGSSEKDQPPCPVCGIEKAEWKGNSGEGVHQGGETYCCKGCAEESGCTCAEEGISQEPGRIPASGGVARLEEERSRRFSRGGIKADSTSWPRARSVSRQQKTVQRGRKSKRFKATKNMKHTLSGGRTTRH
jgi:hypothetical protein